MNRAILLACAVSLAATGSSLAASPETVQGYGQHVPLNAAVRQIVPANYSVSYARNVDWSEAVDWQGGSDWQSVLRSISLGGGRHVAITVSGSTVTVGGRGEEAAPKPEPVRVQPAPVAEVAVPVAVAVPVVAVPAPDAAPSRPVMSPAEVAAAWASRKAPGPQAAVAVRGSSVQQGTRGLLVMPTRGAAPAEPLPVAEVPVAAVPVAVPSPAVVAPAVVAVPAVVVPVAVPELVPVVPEHRAMTARERRAQAVSDREAARIAGASAGESSSAAPPQAASVRGQWVAKENQTLNSVLADWADKAGWKLVYSSRMIYEIQAGASFQGDFEQAALALIKSVHVTPRPIPRFWHGNNTLTVTNLSEEAN